MIRHDSAHSVRLFFIPPGWSRRRVDATEPTCNSPSLRRPPIYTTSYHQLHHPSPCRIQSPQSLILVISQPFSPPLRVPSSSSSPALSSRKLRPHPRSPIMASEFSNGISTHPLRRERFSEIPTNINIPVSAGDEEYDDENAVVEVERDALPDDPMELCTLLENENSPRHFWLQIALSYAKHRRVDTAIEIVTIGLARPTLPSQDRLPLLHCLTYLLLERCRSAPLVATGSGEEILSVPEGWRRWCRRCS